MVGILYVSHSSQVCCYDVLEDVIIKYIAMVSGFDPFSKDLEGFPL